MRNTVIPITELSSRRDNLTNQTENNSVAIFLSNTTQIRNADVEYPFRQDSNFWFLTGIDDADCILLVKKVRGEITTCLYIPKFDEHKALWTGQDLTAEKAKLESGIEQINFVEDFESDLVNICSGINSVYFNEGLENWSEMRRTISKFIKGQSRRSNAENIISFHKTSVLINKLRLYKSDWEIEQMRISNRIALEAHKKVQDYLYEVKENVYEYQLEAILYNHFKTNGCEWSYPAIVAAGNNANILHYGRNNTLINKNDLILIDAGCEYNYCASDITRCYTIGGEFTEPQKIILELVQKAQTAAIQNLSEPNATMVSYHNSAIKVLTQGLIDLGILTGSIESNIENKTYQKYYPHGTGHFLGLDVHDVGQYRNLDGTRAEVKIQPRMCMTVEPGLYFSKDDMSIPAEFRGIGVRIEDDIVIRSDGSVEILGKLN
jgi:Xaa-Pro aminopeptidase